MTNPPLPDGTPQPNDPYTPVDYPASYPQLPPPVYPSPYPQPTAYGYPPPSYAYPPPGYADPYDPYRTSTPPGTNGKAIASLATSLAGLLCGLPAIAGLILGIIAMRETKRTGQEGHGLALAGVIIGGVVTAGMVLYFLFFIVMVIVGASTAPDYPT